MAAETALAVKLSLKESGAIRIFRMNFLVVFATSYCFYRN